MDKRVAIIRYQIKRSLRFTLVLGWFFLALTLSVTLLAFAGLLNFSGQPIAWQFLSDPYLHSVLKFTLLQAALSALLSTALAWPVAMALQYLENNAYKKLFLNLCILCFVMPTLVIITGLIILFNQQGIIGQWLWDGWKLYGLNGILIAHIYINLPFAIRSVYLCLSTIPDSRWKLAQQLKLSRWQRFRILEWPAAQKTTWLVFGLILVLCCNSFAVVLALGGGPQSTTLEVAIYQALKYDFNIPEALVLAWLQLFIAGSLYLLVTTFGNSQWLGIETTGQRLLPPPTKWEKIAYRIIYPVAWLFLLAPILAMLPELSLSSLSVDFWLELIPSTLTSLGLALGGTLITVFIAYMVLKPYRRALRRRSASYIWIDGIASHALVVPGMVLSVGLFIFFIHRIDLQAWGFWFVLLINALISIPFAISQLKAALVNYDRHYSRLIQTLKLTLPQRFSIEWRFAKPAVKTSAAFVSVLILGDVAIYSIFGTQDFTTLPWLVYSYASTYRLTEAAIACYLLLLVSGLIVTLLEKK